MYRIADLLLRYKEYVAALVLIVISLILIGQSSSSQLRSFRTISVGIIASVQSAFSWLPNPYAVKSENRALRQLNKELALEVMQLREAGIKVEKLRSMLEFKQKSPMRLLSAEVLGKSTIENRNYATLNVGSKNGVKEGMPVITDRGLVGRIIGLSDNYSIVELLLNRDTRVSVRTLRGRNEGILSWDRGRWLLLRQIENFRPQPPTDTVITSSYSSLFPENIVVGTIAKIEEEQGTLFYRVTVDPAVDFATLEEAFVVLYMPSTERLDLERRSIEGHEHDGSNGSAR